MGGGTAVEWGSKDRGQRHLSVQSHSKEGWGWGVGWALVGRRLINEASL